MRSLLRIVKYYETESEIEKYSFKTDIWTDAESEADVANVEKAEDDEPESIQNFLEELEEGVPEAEESTENPESLKDVDTENAFENFEEEQEEEPMPQKQAEEIIEKAQQQAEEIEKEARERAAQMEKEAYTSGYERGSKEGFEFAHDEQKKLLEKEAYEFLMDLDGIVNDVEEVKAELLQKYRKDMKNIAIAVGEKVIQISLKSSGDVIERMIESATEKLKRKEWMKVYIAKCDAEVLMSGDSQLMRNLSRISKHAKLIVMENETPGTCIIELPDEIIDASAQTQVANIKEILNNASI